jgi:hypothetical protein
MQPASNPLATADQAAVESLALQLIEVPEVRAVREQARALLLGDQACGSPDGRKGLDRALDQWVLAVAMRIANDDSDPPKIIWNVDNTPRSWFGHTYLGAAVAVDNPDNINRDMLLEGARSYVLTGQLGSQPTQFTLTLETQLPRHEGIGRHLAALNSQQLVSNVDGSFTVTIDAGAADGRANHLQSAPGRLYLFARDSLSDWRQTATALQLECVAGAAGMAPAAQSVLRSRLVDALPSFVDYWRSFKNTFLGFPAPNALSAPVGRPGGWGYLVGGRFELSGEMALVITTCDGGAAYTGFQVTDPWTIAPDPIYHTSSLNKAQAAPNPDGTYTYVMSLGDPGVHNWIDTVGLHAGWMLLRWQGVPTETVATSLVREMQCVQLRDLAAALPAGVPMATLETRRKQVQRRSAEHALRTRE